MNGGWSTCNGDMALTVQCLLDRLEVDCNDMFDLCRTEIIEYESYVMHYNTNGL